jgi:hypothetical protein
MAVALRELTCWATCGGHGEGGWRMGSLASRGRNSHAAPFQIGKGSPNR